ncbi:hypothetical protein TTHERM_00672130 (macronuclear) [Tetrahymena thermophila SB210]|uniref:Uncharacterized protein n=1 Tax=Tetrahymena thermophila (strain SB210) TaxID=312017 RepID=Q23E42_TETTS|nr:hypothetical protein TTHERM_00672130 [Tetrahymena thermophila SB210]EAR94745.1 hypothetical protein TTHERM_00672130 [Tetrahymena thermophila SB210]|eukprot:XP_001014990.1 hypothetical protein TTHERM_00672130 [Tetrahymena thermophila SB210]
MKKQNLQIEFDCCKDNFEERYKQKKHNLHDRLFNQRSKNHRFVSLGGDAELNGVFGFCEKISYNADVALFFDNQFRPFSKYEISLLFIGDLGTLWANSSFLSHLTIKLRGFTSQVWIMHTGCGNPDLHCIYYKQFNQTNQKILDKVIKKFGFIAL